MAFDDIVSAYLRIYSRPQLETALATALANHSCGVTVTSVSYEGGQNVGTINGKSEDLITILNSCLARLDAGYPNDQVDQSTSHWDFSRTCLGT